MWYSFHLTLYYIFPIYGMETAVSFLQSAIDVRSFLTSWLLRVHAPLLRAWVPFLRALESLLRMCAPLLSVETPLLRRCALLMPLTLVLRRLRWGEGARRRLG